MQLTLSGREFEATVQGKAVASDDRMVFDKCSVHVRLSGGGGGGGGGG